MDMSLSKLWEIVKDREAWGTLVHGSQRVKHDLVTEQQHHLQKQQQQQQQKKKQCNSVRLKTWYILVSQSEHTG